MLYGILLFLLVVVSLFLMIFVLMQSDKGGGLAGSIGGMSGGMPFSGREAATILTKGTTVLAISFMVICILLSVMSKNRASVASSNSTLQKRAEKLKSIESNAASSVLDRSFQSGGEAVLPLPAQSEGDNGSNQAPTTNTVTIPGLTE